MARFARSRSANHYTAVVNRVETLPRRVESTQPGSERERRRWPRRLAVILSWVVPLAFLAWAARLVFLEGYLYEVGTDFLGSDFTRTARLGSPEWWTGTGLFYGPIFVLEYLFLFVPQVVSNGDFARIDFLLFGLAFACAWLACFGWARPPLAVFGLAAWLGHHASVEVFSNTAHLEVLELLFMAAGLLLAVRARPYAAGSMLGLAIATKTLPGLFLPYLALTRRWRMLGAASVSFGALFVLVCWLQGLNPIQGAYSLLYQGGNLTKLEFTEYELSPRADIARILAQGATVLTPEQGALAVGLHFAIALAAAALVAVVLIRAYLSARSYGLMFGLISALMLVASPSAHVHYYVFLLISWTALLAEVVRRGMSRLSVGLSAGLVFGYVFTGFDQPFFLMQRIIGFGLVVPRNWLPWHLPMLGLLVTLLATAVALLSIDRPDRQTVRTPSRLPSPAP
jgi:Glycosyltransferase family 87